MNDRKVLIDIGFNCSKIRKAIGYTQKELAIQFKIPETQISNFEYGKINNAIIYHLYLKLKEEYEV